MKIKAYFSQSHQLQRKNSQLTYLINLFNEHLNFETKFSQICYVVWRLSIPSSVSIIGMFDLLWVPNFIKVRVHNSGTKFAQNCNFWSGSIIQSSIFIIRMSNLFLVQNFMKLEHISVLGQNLPKSVIFGQDLQFQVVYS